MIKRLLLVAALTLQGGCISALLDDGCGPVHRFTTANGEIRDGATLIAFVEVELQEQRGADTELSIIMLGPRNSLGAPLRGHVLGARLVHGVTGATMGTFPIQPAPSGGDEVIGSTRAPVADVGAVKRALLDGDARLVLETDLPAGQVVAQLPKARGGDWGRASCS
jgi:hypothetical protein